MRVLNGTQDREPESCLGMKSGFLRLHFLWIFLAETVLNSYGLYSSIYLRPAYILAFWWSKQTWSNLNQTNLCLTPFPLSKDLPP